MPGGSEIPARAAGPLYHSASPTLGRKSFEPPVPYEELVQSLSNTDSASSLSSCTRRLPTCWVDAPQGESLEFSRGGLGIFAGQVVERFVQLGKRSPFLPDLGQLAVLLRGQLGSALGRVRARQAEQRSRPVWGSAE